jgi:DNA-binding CsgD family transcriptional regulator
VTRVLPELSGHMAAALLAERSVHAFLRNDPALLQQISRDLLELDAPAEAAVADAFRLDRAGARKAAVTRLEPVAAGRMTSVLAATRLVALVFKAQLDDSLGDAAAADGLLAEAVRRTSAQMDSDPFVSWSVQGTPTIDLLRRHAGSDPSSWLSELVVVADERDGLAATMRTAREVPASASAGPAAAEHAHIPGLTRREHDVLVQLANGSSYADIAETLFVSENTVKTHVSSLYAKLGATRRSQALKIARAQRLL